MSGVCHCHYWCFLWVVNFIIDWSNIIFCLCVIYSTFIFVSEVIYSIVGLLHAWSISLLIHLNSDVVFYSIIELFNARYVSSVPKHRNSESCSKLPWTVLGQCIVTCSCHWFLFSLPLQYNRKPGFSFRGFCFCWLFCLGPIRIMLAAGMVAFFESLLIGLFASNDFFFEKHTYAWRSLGSSWRRHWQWIDHNPLSKYGTIFCAFEKPVAAWIVETVALGVRIFLYPIVDCSHSFMFMCRNQKIGKTQCPLPPQVGWCGHTASIANCRTTLRFPCVLAGW